MKRLASALLVTVLWTAMSAQSFAVIPVSTFTLTDYLDESDDSTLTPPYEAVATLQYTAASALSDGTYAWDALNPSVSITFIGGLTFTDGNLITPTSEVDIEIVGSGFLLTNVDGTDGLGIYGGNSATFQETVDSDLYELGTEPGYPGGDFEFSGYSDTPQWYGAYDGDAEVGGNYGPVPEPSRWAWLIALGASGLVIRRRFRAPVDVVRAS